MDISAFDRNVPAAPIQIAQAPVDHAVANREVVQAVKALNGTEMFGHDNQLRFQRDPETRRMVVQVVSNSTGEVMSQIPAEYVLRLAEDFKLSQP